MTGPELQINPKSIKTCIGETSQVRFIYVFNLLTHDFFSTIGKTLRTSVERLKNRKNTFVQAH